MTTSDDPEQIAYGLGQIAAFIRTDQWRLSESLGLTPTQIGILSLLRDRGPARITAFARLMGVTQATASDAAAALLDKGLIERRPDPEDGRARLLHLTRRGRNMATRHISPPEPLTRAIAKLGPADRGHLRECLSRTIRELQKAGAIEPQRLCVTCAYFRPHAHPGADKPHHCSFVDAAFGSASLRLDCGDHVEADDTRQSGTWERFNAV